MAKEAYYFSHDANAHDDPKCMILIDQLGMEGYGIFWSLIEKLRSDPYYKLPFIVVPALAKRWGTSTEKIKTVICDFGLFIIEDECFFSERLIRSMEEKSSKGRLAANKRWKPDASAMQTHASALHVHSGCNANAMQNDANKEKESKGKENKGKENKVKGGDESPKPKSEKNSIQKIFRESEWFDKEKLAAAMQGTQYEGANMNYYHEVLLNWSDSKGAKKIDWLATCKNWMAKDMTEGKFITKNFKPNGNTTKNQQPTGANVSMASLYDRIMQFPDQVGKPGN